jgi:hypothetical protein
MESHEDRFTGSQVNIIALMLRMLLPVLFFFFVRGSGRPSRRKALYSGISYIAAFPAETFSYGADPNVPR